MLALAIPCGVLISASDPGTKNMLALANTFVVLRPGADPGTKDQFALMGVGTPVF
jgi:hypothetical protein